MELADALTVLRYRLEALAWSRLEGPLDLEAEQEYKQLCAQETVLLARMPISQ